MSENDPLILVIEDELAIRRFLRATLPNHAYRLAEAITGQDGLAQAGTAGGCPYHALAGTIRNRQGSLKLEGDPFLLCKGSQGDDHLTK